LFLKLRRFLLEKWQKFKKKYKKLEKISFILINCVLLYSSRRNRRFYCALMSVTYFLAKPKHLIIIGVTGASDAFYAALQRRDFNGKRNY